MQRTAEKLERIIAGGLFHPLVVFVIAVLVLAAYSNTFHAAFQFDDLHNITENPLIHDTGNIPALLKSPRGITKASFALNYAVGGEDPFGYHVVNYFIHVINSALVYFFLFLTFGLCRFEGSRARIPAAFIALIFALHPVQTQGVTYIVQRMESLASLFYLLAFIFFIKAAGAGSTAGRGALYCLVGVSFVFGFYSKEITYTLPALILLFDLFFVSDGRITGLFKRWPLYLALATLFVFFTVKTVIPVGGFSDLSQDSAAASVQKVEKKKLIPGTDIPVQRDITAGFSMPMYSPKEYLFTQFNVMLYYLTVLIVPANQNLDYDFPISYDFFSTPEVREGTTLNIPIPPPAVSFAVLLAIAVAAVAAAARSFKSGAFTGRIAAFFVFWYFIILSPTSSFIPIADVIFEHRVYLPSLGFFVILVICIERLFTKIFCRDIGAERSGG